ncbi:MAG: CPBP family intramembrane metalloprotease [Burkholderiaceae bacterium]|jgi:membrane protease YdiL (CAAX protease family)|nr:CPBP family intramembrane metalloprotease [Burkholderiaceae bacterium]
MAHIDRTTTTFGEAAAIIAICFGWPIMVSTLSVVRGFQNVAFTDAGFIGLMVMEAVFAAIALLILRVRKYSIFSLYPAPSLRGAGLAVLLFIASWLVSFVLVTFFATTGQPEQPISKMMETASVSLPTLVLTALVNGAYEEIFLLGFLLRGLRGYGLSVALGISLLVRVLYHLYQGPLGAVSVLGFGLVLSIYYIRTGSLFPAVFAHVLADIVPFIIQSMSI